MENSNVLEALKYIDVASLSYSEWVQVGMALKAEGYDWTVWDTWSQQDSRYKQGECERKWRTFTSSGKNVAGGTIVQMAKERGYNPHRFEGDGCIGWDDYIEYDGDGVTFEAPVPMSPSEQLKLYLTTLFKPDEIVGYVTNDVWQNSEGKWLPAKGTYHRTCKELLDDLERYPDDLGATIGDWKKECGAWIRFNPLDGKGVRNENVVRFTYALVESDDMPISEQDALYRKLQLPIATLVHSGGKSLHAIVRVDAEDAEEYRKRVDFLYDYLEKSGLKIDRQNRNPSRLSRMPAVTRNGREQTLIATNIGKASWNEWLDFAEGDCDDLPQLISLDDALANPPKVPDELIEGVLRCGHKMLLTGCSKAGKSTLLMELAVSLSEGWQWLGFNCRKTKVLYVNLEIDPASCIHRFVEIYDALSRRFHLTPHHTKDVVIWNLRGHAIPLDKLVPKLIRKIYNQGFGAVIIDPIYKVITGDENNASEMGQFCNQFDKLCQAAGCAAIYCHHHSKGAQGYKKAMDRASGSGVFARDPDAQLDIIQLETSDEFMYANADNLSATAWRLECSLREFANFKPRNFWFDYPLHTVDEKGMLNGLHSEGDPKSNLAKSGKRNQTPEKRKEDFDSAFEINAQSNGSCTISDLARYLMVDERTIRSRVKEFSADYYIENKVVYRQK